MSVIAQNRIKEAKEKKSKILNLGKCGLSTIPPEVLEMTWLEELILSNRVFDFQEKEWVEMSEEGSNNVLKELPGNLQELINLKILKMVGDYGADGNNISNIQIIGNLTSLTTLEIRSNKISDGSFLKGLTSLTTLDISSNKISDGSFLKGLTSLTTLEIRSNKISDFSFLKDLASLTTLDISVNYKNIIDFSFLKGLTGLTTLEINLNRISDVSFLKGLTNLTTLDIKENGISDVSFLKGLTSLTILDIGFNKISDVSFLKGLTSLTMLDIGFNKISDVSFLKGLTSLTTLEIRSNKISDVSFLKGLTSLTKLGIGNNNISDVSFLKGLTSLTMLDISSNNISDVSFLKGLTSLTTLEIRSNKISDFSFLKGLTSLTMLDIRFNKISDVSFLKGLTSLTTLDISYNKISDVSFLKSLTNLTQLNLTNNEISDISSLKRLTSLTELDISSNNLSDFTPLLHLVKKGLIVKTKKSYGRLCVEDNSWSTPPIEVMQNGNEAILDYFLELEEQGKDYLFEAKMLIVGRGGAGKTSLVKKLLNRKATLPEEEETTHGIDIEKLSFGCENDKNFTINIWDFGGQEIYHSTHQFFLTKRSLYVLVDDTKDDDKSVNDASFNYWLQTVKLFGAGSPLLIFQNEKGGRSKDLDIKSMQGRFDFIKDKHADNLNSPKDGLNEFEKDVIHHVQKLPHIGQVVPKQWVKIRKELLNKAKETPYISLDQYYEICKQFNIDETEKMLHLSQYLHDLGTFLHFQNDDLLRKTIILSNEWATDAVYKVLDNETIKRKKGKFTKKETTSIWHESVYKDMHPELLVLMLKFELCYKLNNKEETYLIPQLLPESKPDNITWNTENNLQLRYEYVFMPKGLLSRFIVRTNLYLKDVANGWKKGVVLEKNGTFAFVEEKYGINEIEIRVRGLDQKEMLTILTEELDRLNSDYEGIEVKKLIPCNCTTCINMEKPHFYAYQDIKDRYRYKKDTIECSKKPYEDVSVIGLLDNFMDNYVEEIRLKEGRRLLKEDTNRFDVKGDLIIGNGNISIKDVNEAEIGINES